MADEMMPNSTSTDFGAASSSNSQPSPPQPQPQPQPLQFHALPQSPLSPSTMRSCLWAICVSGVLLNVLVFHKYRRSRCRHSPSVRSSLQLLCVMAGADTLSLLALMLALGSRHFAKLHFGERHWLLGAICKLDLFLIHASSAFGIWCWFILSSVRYLAIHHPYTHLRLHKEPLLTVLCVAVCCCVLELWIPFDITYLDDLGVCGETLPEQLGKALQLTEILWTYFLPLSLITVLDLKVLCCPAAWSNPVVASEEMPQRELLRSVTTESGLETSSGESLPSPQPYTGQTQPFLTQHKMSTASGPRSSKSKRRAQQLHILRRFLCISIIELGMNLPNYLIRLYLTLVSEEALEQMDRSATFLWAQDISQLLYFAQFAMNALYLVAINYVTAPAARRSSPQQLSIAAVFAHQPSHQQSFMGIRSSAAGIPRMAAAAAAGGGGC